MREAFREAAAEVLPPARKRRSYDWYTENQVVIEAAAKRCRELKQAMPASAGRRARSRKAWKAAQRGYRKLLKQCRDKWHLSLMAEANRYDHTSVWKVIQQMKAGRRLTAKVKDQPFEAAEAAKFFTENVFNIRRDGIDATAVAALRQRALRPGMDAVPTLDELKAALALCKRGKSSSNGVPVEFYQALIHDDEALGLLHAFYAELWGSGAWPTGDVPEVEPPPDLTGWESFSKAQQRDLARAWGLRLRWMPENPKRDASKERYERYRAARTMEEAMAMGATAGDLQWDHERGYLTVIPERAEPPVSFTPAADSPALFPSEWRVLRCVLLHKKGPLADLDNWRGIMLSDSSLKVFSGILDARLRVVLREHGIEVQCGFTKGRGCSDAIYSLVRSLGVRKEHGLNTWLASLDLRKAYDSVPRDVLWPVLRKFGIPAHFIEIVQRTYAGLAVNLQLDAGMTEVPNSSGLKQGCKMSPTLWLFVMQAALELVQPRWHGGLVFHTDLTSSKRTTGVAWERRGSLPDGFLAWALALADDLVILSDSREHLAANLAMLDEVFMKLGLSISAPKTKCMAVRGHGNIERMQQRAPIVLPTGDKIQFTAAIKYLGIVVHRSLDGADPVMARIAAANAAFGALSKPLLRAKHVSAHVKGRIYERMVLSTLLYGSEAWTLTSESWRALRHFHNTKVRCMVGTTRWHSRSFRLRDADLRARLGLSSIATYTAERATQWYGHVARMGVERLPHRLAFSWVRHPRPAGGRPVSLGDTLRTHLRHLGAPTEDKDWIPMALAREGPFSTSRTRRGPVPAGGGILT